MQSTTRLMALPTFHMYYDAFHALFFFNEASSHHPRNRPTLINIIGKGTKRSALSKIVGVVSASSLASLYFGREDVEETGRTSACCSVRAFTAKKFVPNYVQ